MDLSPSNFVSINQILSDVLRVVDDSSFKLNSRGWYISQIQQALEELSFDTFFDERNQSFEMPDNLRLEMPKGAFNIRQVYLFNGDDCTIGQTVNVYYKNNFINGRSGNGYVARDKWRNPDDPFYQSRINRDFTEPDRNFEEPNNLRFFSIQNGMLMFSESCRSHQRVMIVYNGIMTDIGETPVVPQFFRQAVKDWVLVKALEMKATDKVGTNEYGHWMNLKNTYKNDLERPYEGSWVKAERRAKVLNEKHRQDLKEYMSRLNY